jgi:YebC/PmpR family DNA-binding regulatory protein
MSGHSKWHSIRHKKAIVDAKRGAKFTKMIKEIQIAARMGGSDPNGNPRLRTAIQAAKDVNMPKDNIERAIKKGAGELEGVSYEDFTFEGYGQAGVAILVEGTTDNMNRTAPEIRHAFGKFGGSMGEPGCVGWMFKTRGYVDLTAAGIDEDRAMEAALEAGAQDVALEGEIYRVMTEQGELESVRKSLEKAGLPVVGSSVEKTPDTFIKVEGDQVGKLLKLIETLEEHDDVSNVWSNCDIDDALIEQCSD